MSISFSSSQLFKHPDQRTLLRLAMHRTEIPLIKLIDSQTLKKYSERSLIKRMKAVARQIMHELKLFFLPKYRKRFKIAKQRINTAFETYNKTATAIVPKAKQSPSTPPPNTSLVAAVSVIDKDLKKLEQEKQSLTTEMASENTAFAKDMEHLALLENYRNLLLSQQENGNTPELLAKLEGIRTNPLINKDLSTLDDVLQEIRTLTRVIQQRTAKVDDCNRQLAKVKGTVEQKQQEAATQKLIVQVAPPPPPLPPTPKEEMFHSLAEKGISQDIQNLWHTLFDKIFNPEAIVSWKCDQDGSFTLTLTHSLRLWVPSNSTDSGAIFTLGNDQATVQGKLTQQAIEFKNGYSIICSVGFIVKPQITALKQESGNKLSIISKFGIKKNTTTEKATDLIHGWTTDGIIVPKDIDSEQFLKTKKKKH